MTLGTLAVLRQGLAPGDLVGPNPDRTAHPGGVDAEAAVNLDDQKVPSFKGFTPLGYLPWWRCVASFIGYVTRRMKKCLDPCRDACVWATSAYRPESPCRRCGLFPIGLRGLSRSGWGRIVWLPSEGPDTRPGCVTMKLSSLGGSGRRAATPWASVFVTHVVPSGTPEGVAWRGTSWPRACTAKGRMSTRRTLNCVVAQTDYQESCVRGAVYRDGSPSQRPPRRPVK